MELSDNTILITGGSEGIGFELARALAAKNTVLICGRSEEKLARAQERLPDVVTEVCDLTDAEQRTSLVERVLRSHPALNVLINNAGGREQVDLASGEGVEAALAHDLALNFTAPVDLCGRLLPHLQKKPRAAVVNVTTGLVYLPKAAQPFYCAAKAALHSYSQSLRWALRGSSVKVFEVMMPLVDTGFHKGTLPTNLRAMSAEEVTRDALAALERGRGEILVGKSAVARWVSLLAPSRGLAIVNR